MRKSPQPEVRAGLRRGKPFTFAGTKFKPASGEEIDALKIRASIRLGLVELRCDAPARGGFTELQVAVLGELKSDGSWSGRGRLRSSWTTLFRVSELEEVCVAAAVRGVKIELC